jgi:AcrR family transcriptional regulator
MISGTVKQRDRAQRRPRADGERARGAILRAAASLATIDGLEGLSIGNLAAAIGMSKSGLYAHFGSKQELQLATVEEAGRILAEEVAQPALAAPPGLAQLAAVCEAFFDYLQRRVFPGGCFFAAASLEMGTRPGPVKERVAALQSGFAALVRQFAATAIEQNELPAREDPDRLAFELHGIMLAADTNFVLHDDPAVLNLARQIVRQRLGLGNGGNAGESWGRGPALRSPPGTGKPPDTSAPAAKP